MGVYKRGDVWWFKFTWNAKQIRESTKQTNKRIAEQIESSRKTGLAKGEVGIRDRAPVPTLKDFARLDFLPHVETRFADKATTLAYYRVNIRHLVEYGPLANTALDAITAELIGGFIAKRRAAGYQVSSINRVLQVLRRMLKLAEEWGKVPKAAKVSLQPGERRRERVLSSDEEMRYMKAASEFGDGILEAYRRALEGIRAVDRGLVPVQPVDPYLLRDVATAADAVGFLPQPVRSCVLGGTQRLLNDQALRSPECGRSKGNDGAGAKCPGRAQFWAQCSRWSAGANGANHGN
jgi:Phage integrase, N-terminal SAM-like domain